MYIIQNNVYLHLFTVYSNIKYIAIAQCTIKSYNYQNKLRTLLVFKHYVQFRFKMQIPSNFFKNYNSTVQHFHLMLVAQKTVFVDLQTVNIMHNSSFEHGMYRCMPELACRILKMWMSSKSCFRFYTDLWHELCQRFAQISVLQAKTHQMYAK